MKKILFLLIALASIGCATQKRCLENFPPVVSSDTVEVSTIEFRDTIIKVFLPGDTIYEEVLVDAPCEDPEDSVVLIPGPLPIDTLTALGSYSEASAWIESSRLRLRLIEHEQLLEMEIDSVVRLAEYYRELSTVEVHTVPAKVPWYFRASLPVAIVLLFLWILFIVFVVLRR